MGNAMGCPGSRLRAKGSFKTQLKIQEVMGSITAQEFENKIKKFASRGLISRRQLAEVTGHHQLRSRDNALLNDILQNPFFHASQEEIDAAQREEDRADGERNGNPNESKSSKSGDKQEITEDKAELRDENEKAKKNAEGGPATGNEDAGQASDGMDKDDAGKDANEVASSQSDVLAELDFSKYNRIQR